MDQVFTNWRNKTTILLKGQKTGLKPKQLIQQIAEDLLTAYSDRHLMDKYDVYQHLMNYWNETMQDDCYIIAADGWKAEVYRILVENKKGAKVDKGWACDLLPAQLLIDQYFLNKKKQHSTVGG